MSEVHLYVRLVASPNTGNKRALVEAGALDGLRDLLDQPSAEVRPTRFWYPTCRCRV